jgi:hypothetical protein
VSEWGRAGLNGSEKRGERKSSLVIFGGDYITIVAPVLYSYSTAREWSDSLFESNPELRDLAMILVSNT